MPPDQDPSSAFSLDFIVSRDGTKIGFRRYGRGPGIILVQGAMSTAHNYDGLARLLAKDFTVIVPDRRGRGLSPRDFDPDYCLQREMEDLEGLFDRTEALFLFGLSSGAVIALEASRQLTSVHKAILYEPPFPVGSERFHLVPRFNREVAEGDFPSAMVTAQKMVQLAPPVLGLLPRSLLRLLTGAVLRRDDLNHGDYEPFRAMLPAMRFDFRVVSEMQSGDGTLNSINVETLLLGGTRSPAYLKRALDRMEQTLPKARRIAFSGLAHNGPFNADRGGEPGVIAQAIRAFATGS